MTAMTFPSGYLAEHPLPPGIVGALSLSGYQLLVDIAGIGAGRLGSETFLLIADPPDHAQEGAGADPAAQISLHQPRLRDERDAAAYVQLAAQLGFLRLSGYRVAAERAGLRSRVKVINPATGAIVSVIPEKHPGRLLGGSRTAVTGLLSALRSLPPAGPPPDLQHPELLHQMLLSMALGDESLGGAEAAEAADRALELTRSDSSLDPVQALEAAKRHPDG